MHKAGQPNSASRPAQRGLPRRDLAVLQKGPRAFENLLFPHKPLFTRVTRFALRPLHFSLFTLLAPFSSPRLAEQRRWPAGSTPVGGASGRWRGRDAKASPYPGRTHRWPQLALAWLVGARPCAAAGTAAQSTAARRRLTATDLLRPR